MNYTVVSYKDLGYVMAQFAKDTTLTIKSAKTPEGNIFFLVSTRNDATARAITARKIESTPLWLCAKLFPSAYRAKWVRFCAAQSYEIEIYATGEEREPTATLTNPAELKNHSFAYADVWINGGENEVCGKRAEVLAELELMGF